MRDHDSVFGFGNEGISTEELVDGVDDAVGVCPVAFDDTVDESLGNEPASLGYFLSDELSEFVVTLQEMHLVGEFQFPASSLEE